MIDYEVGQKICEIAQDTYSTFSKVPDVSVRFFGSLAKAVHTGEVPKSNVHDLDIDVLGCDQSQLEKVTEFYKNQAKKHSDKNIVVEAKVVGGSVRPEPHPSKRKLFLHLMPVDDKSFNLIPAYVRHSMWKYGVPIVGQLPDSARVERIGLTNILGESKRRIKQLTGTAKGEDAINRILRNGVAIEMPNEVAPDSLEFESCVIRNSATNIMAALQPYLARPHFEDSSKVFYDFKKLFSQHPWKDLPLEVDKLTKVSRKGKKVNIKGLHKEALNYFSFTDQMIRNMIGVN